MALGRRAIVVFLLLSAAIGFAAAYGALHLRAGGWSWKFSLPWTQMESLLESQVISSTAVDVELNPSEGRITGTATLGVQSPGGGGTRVVLLLNRGLEVSAISCNGEKAPWRREEDRLVVVMPENIAEPTLEITYAGQMVHANGSLLVTAPDLFIADRLQWWYPLDLKSFPTFEATVRVPEGTEVAAGGAPQESRVENGRHVVSWREPRPILASGLVAGQFERTSRVQGGIRCIVYARGAESDTIDTWLSALGDSYNYYSTLFGPDGFQQLNLVVVEETAGVRQIGGPTLVAGKAALEDPEGAFPALAREVAHGWWGDTVSGRWFTSRPEAGEWLVSGMAEYCAWQALRQVKGRRSYLRYKEQLYYPPGTQRPMRDFNLDRRLRSDSPVDPSLLQVRGPYAAEAIAQFIGRDAFERACRNFLAVHRHTTVSYAALLHEMTLASEQPLEELVRVWFDRPGTFDYGISSVSADGGRAHVTIENKGNIPAFVPLALGVITADSYQVQSVDPGSSGDTFSFPIGSPVKRVVLDPEFALGDMLRANNVWPPTQWPVALDVSRNGRIALLAQTDWGGTGGRQIQVFSLVDKNAGYAIALDTDGAVTMQWAPDGQQLALAGARGGLWHREQWTPAPDGSVFLGWHDEKSLYWQDGQISGGNDGGVAPAVPLPAPKPGFSAVHPRTGALAYITENDVLTIWDPASGRLAPLRARTHPGGSLNWRGEESAVMFFDADGPLLSLDADTGELTTLLRRDYAIARSKVSAPGNFVAWVDPAGLLRAFTPGGGDAAYISLPGEVVDFAWEGEDAIVAIVATVPRRLPMRYHAEYTLWRVPASTWIGVQLPYDPAQFTATAGQTTVYTLE